ncbi:MAG: hypothetical protein KF690_01850 [Bacteroidetes bacterium]|nr:hypothetical protein [Bacteroidota bacterium]
MMEGNITLYVLGGLVITGILIMVLAIFRKKKVDHTQLEDFLEKLGMKTHTFPKPNDDGVSGKYKDFAIDVTGRMWVGTTRTEHSEGTRVDKTQYDWKTFNPKLKVVLKAPGRTFPPLAIWDDMSWLPSGTVLPEMRQRLQPGLPKASVDAKALNPHVAIYTEHPAAALNLIASHELHHYLKHWFFTDVRTEGDTITLQLDNGNSYAYFHGRLQKPDYVVQAMDICVAVAHALLKEED